VSDQPRAHLRDGRTPGQPVAGYGQPAGFTGARELPGGICEQSFGAWLPAKRLLSQASAAGAQARPATARAVTRRHRRFGTDPHPHGLLLSAWPRSGMLPTGRYPAPALATGGSKPSAAAEADEGPSVRSRGLHVGL